jgi:WhiB family redox-sensing transcriptional regulator
MSVTPLRPAGVAPMGDSGAADRAWISQGRCVGRDPDELFVTGAAQRDAARICQGCPVRLQCLADALDNQIEFGVWGGLTERQRRAILRQQPNVPSWRVVLEAAAEDRAAS